jgi:hypothetical protein
MTDKNSSLPPEDIAAQVEKAFSRFFKKPEPPKPLEDTSTEFLITLPAGARRVRYADAPTLLAKALYRDGMRAMAADDHEILIRWADFLPRKVLDLCTQIHEEGLRRAFEDGLLKVQDSFRMPLAGRESLDELSRGYIEIGDFIAYAKGFEVEVQIGGGPPTSYTIRGWRRGKPPTSRQIEQNKNRNQSLEDLVKELGGEALSLRSEAIGEKLHKKSPWLFSTPDVAKNWFERNRDLSILPKKKESRNPS